MVEITTNEELELIHKNNEILGIKNVYWLGLTKTGSTWSWEIEGDAQFTNWGSGEPDDYCANGPPCFCAGIVRKSMRWFACSCVTTTRYVLCESNPITSP